MSKKKIVLIIALTLIGAILLALSIEIAVNFTISPLPQSPESNEGSNLIHQLLFYFEHPERADEDGVVIDNDYIVNAITPAKKYIDGRYDCIDFRMQSLIRLEYLYGDKIAQISPKGSKMIKDAFWVLMDDRARRRQHVLLVGKSSDTFRHRRISGGTEVAKRGLYQ